jgi:hypothetical protein
VDLTLSRPVRIFALVAVLVAVAGGGVLMIERKHASTAPSAAELQAREHARAAALRAAAKPHVQARRHAAKPRATSKPVPAKTLPPKPPVLVAANGLPVSLAAALRNHRIVIVAIFDPQSQTDAISYAEARAGAADAGVGFLGVSLLNNKIAAPLTAALPDGSLLPAPGLLIYRRPGTLVQRIDGFADRAAVAQAAVASRTAPALKITTRP